VGLLHVHDPRSQHFVHLKTWVSSLIRQRSFNLNTKQKFGKFCQPCEEAFYIYVCMYVCMTSMKEKTKTAIVNTRVPASVCHLVINLLQRHFHKIKLVLNIDAIFCKNFDSMLLNGLIDFRVKNSLTYFHFGQLDG
jgi:hypothetical protein